MATMYSLFFGFLFTAVCAVNGDGSGVISSLKPREALLYSLINKEANKSRLGQYDAKYFLTGLNISEPLHFAPLYRYVFNDLQKIFSTLYHPKSLDDETPSVSSQDRFVGDRQRKCKGFASIRYHPRSFFKASATTSRSVQSRLMSSVKQFPIKDDLLAYGVKGRKATNSSSVHFALDQDSQSKGATAGQGTLGTASVALRSRDEHRLNSLDLCGTFYQGKVPRQSANKDKRNLILTIASAELGTTEATGNNDGKRVEEYLRYTHLGKGYEWCAAFVSWCYGQAGLPVPRNPWSPALFPKARTYWRSGEKVKRLESEKVKADVFGIYGTKVKRISHVGLVREISKEYLITIEGNSNNRVESRRRHLRTVYALADWVDE